MLSFPAMRSAIARTVLHSRTSVEGRAVCRLVLSSSTSPERSACVGEGVRWSRGIGRLSHEAGKECGAA
eukprot:4275748-Prymnesium_polylepis.1